MTTSLPSSLSTSCYSVHSFASISHFFHAATRWLCVCFSTHFWAPSPAGCNKLSALKGKLPLRKHPMSVRNTEKSKQADWVTKLKLTREVKCFVCGYFSVLISLLRTYCFPLIPPDCFFSGQPMQKTFSLRLVLWKMWIWSHQKQMGIRSWIQLSSETSAGL